MKHIILGLTILALLASCQGPTSKKNKQTIEDQVNTELRKNIKNESIFLDLRFGMGGIEVQNHFKNLVKQDKLLLVPHEYISDKGKIYVYKFEFGDEDFSLQDVLGTFKTYYLQDKLYKLRISVESEKDTSIQLLKSKLKDVYISRYGQNYIMRENIYNNSAVCEWIVGNMMIEISEGLSNNILIIYTDLIAIKESEGTPKEVLMREI